MEESIGRGGADAEQAMLRLVQDHAAELLRFARRFSLCADDAQDAYQRGIEILVRRMRTSPPERPLNWLRTVIRHESAAVRMERERLLGHREIDLDREEDREVEDPSERVTGYERLGQVAEALQRLKSQEVTALVLRAEGLSYKEICTRTGWTYTKCNRAITEGRRALRDRLGAIESGAECDRWLPRLSLLADGEASAQDLAELRPHLRGCQACRATLREFHDAPRQIAVLVPVALVPVTTGDPGAMAGHLAAFAHALVERATLAATRLQGAFDTLPGTKVAAVAASTAALAGSGAALEHAVRPDPPVRAAVHASAGASPVTTLDTASLVTPRMQGIVPTTAHDAADLSRTAPAGEFGVEGAAAAPSEFLADPAATQASSARIAASQPAFTTSPTPSTEPAPTSPPARAEPPAEFAGP